MTHGRLYAEGRISKREYNELVTLKEKSNNPAFTKEYRKEAKRLYREKEKEYGQRSRPQMIRDMERRR